MLHNGFIHLSKPRLGSAPPEIIPHSPLPPEWELSLAPGIIGSLSIVVLIILHGNLFAQAFVFPTVFLAGWDSALHIFEGDGRLNAESFSNLIRQVENSRAKKALPSAKRLLMGFFPPTVTIVPFVLSPSKSVLLICLGWYIS